MPFPATVGTAGLAKTLMPGTGFDPFSLLAGPSSLPGLAGGDGGNATSISSGTFVSGQFNPVFGSDASVEQQAVRSVLPIVGIVAAVWLLARK